ncbi:MAG: hypothetical protein ACYTDT_08325 [Planctomycetota bacterium]|jgi:hypothetical protein
MDAPDQQLKRLPLWPLLYCVSPILIGLGLVLYVNWDDTPVVNNSGPEIPALGGDERPMTNGSTAYDPDEPANNSEDTTASNEPDGVEENPEDEPEPEPPVETSERQIDIYIQRLAHAAKVRDAKGVTSNRGLLAEAHPPELVD